MAEEGGAVSCDADFVARNHLHKKEVSWARTSCFLDHANRGRSTSKAGDKVRQRQRYTSSSKAGNKVRQRQRRTSTSKAGEKVR